MTDIKRHLPHVFKVVQTAYQRETAPDKSILYAQIRELLPDSYAVTSGCLQNPTAARSASLDLILLDKTIGLPGAVENDVRQALAFFSFAHKPNWAEFAELLESIASAKRLRPAKAPLGILFCQGIAEPPEYAEFCLRLTNELKKLPMAERPDYIFLVEQSLSYRNPALDGQIATQDEYISGWGRDPKLTKPRTCYICKMSFFRRHFFYEKLCPACGDFNYFKRIETSDLSGKIALVTGARVKIGYAAALRLLRAGATVIATSRFPHDTARRYATERDFGLWRERLHIYGLDLRHMGALAEFIEYLYRAYPKLDILINNAAQTIRRPPAYYAPLLPFERTPHAELPSALQGILRGIATNLLPGAGEAVLPLSAELSQVSLVPGEGDTGYFPAGKLDRHAQPLDLRPHTSWTYRLEELSIPEIVEVQLINATAPAVLAGQLKELLLADRAENAAPKYIINVAAVEGQFAKEKNGAHPHTNMAKAALNMLTYTSAADYAESGIYMLSVDPGWVSEQRPYVIVRQPDAPEDTPLDLDDAAARICDPLFHNARQAGVLLKDYKVAAW